MCLPLVAAESVTLVIYPFVGSAPRQACQHRRMILHLLSDDALVIFEEHGQDLALSLGQSVNFRVSGRWVKFF